VNISTENNHTLFMGFLRIPIGSYREVVHFYEDYRSEIAQLGFQEQFEIQACYIEALFAMEKYREVLFQVDNVIETAIAFNFSRMWGVDIYFNLLCKKAMSLYHMGRIEEAGKLAVQLLYIDPRDVVIKNFYKHLLLRKSLHLVTPTRVFYISGLLTTILLMMFELLVIWPFYNELDPLIGKVRNIVFIGAIVVFIMGEVFRLVAMEWRTRIKIKQILQQKSLNKKMNQSH